MEKIVLDANIFFKLIKQESDSQQAIKLITTLSENEVIIYAPCVMVNECLHVCEREKIDLTTAHKIFSDLMSFNLNLVNTDLSLFDTAIDITQHGNKTSGYPTFSDSLYHALAIQEDCLFITADKKHLVKTQKKFKHIGLLNDWEKLLM